MKKNASQQKETSELGIPSELVGDARMLIPVTECFGESILGWKLERQKIYNIGLLVAARKQVFSRALDIGPVKRERIKKMLGTLGLRHEMVDKETAKLLFDQISDDAETWMQGEGRRKAQEIVREVFEISPDAAVPASGVKNVTFNLSLPLIFAAAVKSDDALKGNLYKTLSRIVRDEVRQCRLGNYDQPGSPGRKMNIPDVKQTLRFNVPVPWDFSKHANGPCLKNKITREFEQAALEMILKSLRQQLEEITPPSRG